MMLTGLVFVQKTAGFSTFMTAFQNITQLDVKGKKVLVRVDFNVPMDGNHLMDDTRLKAALPTLEHLLNAGAAVILMSHLGRPKGQAQIRFSLAPIAAHLSGLLGRRVTFSPDCVGEKARSAVAKLEEGGVLLLENLRFHAEEEKNDESFAKELAAHADMFVQDAFGAVHRAHASTAGVPRFLPHAAGLLLQKELRFLGGLKDNPQPPVTALIGGAKVSDKIDVLDKLLEKVQTVAVGGAMAYTFLAAQGKKIGSSRWEKDKLDLASDIEKKAKSLGVRFLLPQDHLVVSSIEDYSSALITDGVDIPDGKLGVDIGPKTREIFQTAVKEAKTVFWNGPMGIFETETYAEGTRGVAKACAEAAQSGTTVVIGGGDSVAAVKSMGLGEKITHISTGGGASLEFLEGKDLPGVKALENQPEGLKVS